MLLSQIVGSSFTWSHEEYLYNQVLRPHIITVKYNILMFHKIITRDQVIWYRIFYEFP